MVLQPSLTLQNFFSQAGGTSIIELKPEAFVTDFEYNESGMTNETIYTDANRNNVSWNYDRIKFKQLAEGPDYCASGDMCWGTNFYDTDYTDDVDLAGFSSEFEFRMKTPPVYLDNSMNDTYLRFSSWHQLESKYNNDGGIYYDDCAYLEVEHSVTGQFQGEESIDFLQINFPLSSGISPRQGAYFRSTALEQTNTISAYCDDVSQNNYALGGSSKGPQNSIGWSTIASDLAPYLGKHVRVNFVLYHSDNGGNLLSSTNPGWFIDDISIGEKYTQDALMVINNIQPESSYSKRSPNGYGILYTDTFEPGDSSLRYSFRDSLSGILVTGTDGKLMENLQGPVIELWNIDVDQYPYIDMEVSFNSGNQQISTPKFYGFMLGSEYGVTFNDLASFRDYNLSNGVWEFVADSNKQEQKSLFINSTDFVGDNIWLQFSETCLWA